jgi:hypothetical protein
MSQTEKPLPPEFTCYDLADPAPELRPAPSERDWMDATPLGFAYRCLPLTVANALGWEYLCPSAVEAVWDGGPELSSVRIHSEAPQHFAISHFGSGILTFQLNGLFRTAPGTALFVGGPINRPKDAITALTGIVETDWSPFTFTMNWQFTRPGTIVSFDDEEPIATLFPIDLSALEGLAPVQRPISSQPRLDAEWRAWSASRTLFNKGLGEPGSAARVDKWQKHYHRGTRVDGSHPDATHRTKLKLRPFAR